LPRTLSNDPRLTIISPYDAEKVASAPADDCLIAALTFRGSLPERRYRRMMAAPPNLPAGPTFLGEDPYAPIKQRFDPDVPEAYIEVRDYGRLSREVDLSSWPLKHRQANIDPSKR
jgi:hypothetical protein